MNANCDERQELAEIYNELSEPLKKQLLTIARVMDTTQELTLRYGGIKIKSGKRKNGNSKSNISYYNTENKM